MWAHNFVTLPSVLSGRTWGSNAVVLVPSERFEIWAHIAKKTGGKTRETSLAKLSEFEDMHGSGNMLATSQMYQEGVEYMQANCGWESQLESLQRTRKLCQTPAGRPRNEVARV